MMDDAIVESYVTYVFDPEPKDSLHEHIFNNWFLLLKEKVSLKTSLMTLKTEHLTLLSLCVAFFSL